MSRLDLVVGPNGAGKSTFIRFTLGPNQPGVPLVNADVIAAERWPDAQAEHAYEAARIATRTRASLLERGLPFITETVFSHPSKLDLIHAASAADYEVNLYVIMVPVRQSVERVRRRVESGGHGVPEDKIRGRHERLWSLVADAVLVVDVATFYDNTRDPRVTVAMFAHGLAVRSPKWPVWVHPDLPQKLGGSIAAS